MHLLCCPYLKRNPPPTETDPDSPQPAESRSAPRRSRSIRPPPKPKASKQEIEKFYREGQELARHEREQRERTLLREALREEYQKEGEPSSSSGTPSEKNAPPESEESSLVEILPLDDTKPTPLSAIPEDNGVGYDSNRNFSFETNTERDSVRVKPAHPYGWESPHLRALSPTAERHRLSPTPEVDYTTPVSTLSLSLESHQTFSQDIFEGFTMSGRKVGSNGDLITPDLRPQATSNDEIITPLDMGSPVVGPVKNNYFEQLKTTLTLDSNAIKIEEKESQTFTNDEAVSESVYTVQYDEKSPATLSQANLAKLEASTGSPGTFGPLSEEEDLVPELEPGSERFPRRKESEISNIFSKIPDLLRPSISQFSLGSIGTPVPSPPPRLSSRNYNFPDWHSESEYNESEYGSQYFSKPGTPFQSFRFNKANMESASSFYPSVSPSGRASFDLDSIAGDLQSRSATPGRFSMRQSTDRLRRRSRGDMHWNTIAAQMGRRKKSALDLFDEEDQAKLKTRKRSVSDPQVDLTSIPASVDDDNSKAPRTIIGMMNSEKGAVMVSVAPVLSGTVASITRSDTVIQHQRPSNTIPVRSSLTNIRTPVTPPKRSVKETAQLFSGGASTSRSGPRYRKSGTERPSNLRVVERVDSEDDQSTKLLNQKSIHRSRSLRIKKSISRGFSKVKSTFGSVTSSTATANEDPELDRPPSALSRYDKINYASSSETLRGREHSRAQGAAEIRNVSRQQSQSPIRRMTSSPAAFDKIYSPSSSTASRKPSLARSNTAYPHPNGRSRRGTMSSQSVYRVLRNTAYDDCVAYPFGSDGEDDGYLTEGEGLDLMRKKTPGLVKAMDIFPEEIETVKAGNDGKRTLREMRNTSVNGKIAK